MHGSHLVTTGMRGAVAKYLCDLKFVVVTTVVVNDRIIVIVSRPLALASKPRNPKLLN